MIDPAFTSSSVFSLASPLKIPLPRLYAITDTRSSGVSHIEMTRRLLGAGVTFIQIREKAASSSAFYDQAMACIELAREASACIVVNDRVDIAMAAGAGGVHVGQTDLDPASVRKLVGERMLIGWSSHNLDQAASANQLPADYLAIGPVYSTASKSSPDPTVGLEMVRAVRAVVQKPLVAIGGINRSNFRAVLDAGADSVAVIAGLWRETDLDSFVREVLAF